MNNKQIISMCVCFMLCFVLFSAIVMTHYEQERTRTTEAPVLSNPQTTENINQVQPIWVSGNGTTWVNITMAMTEVR